MLLKTKKNELFERRKKRVRFNISKHNKTKRVRLSVFRSGRHIYAQLIDDVKHMTVASASSVSKELKSTADNLAANIDTAKKVGALLAQKAKDLGINKVVVDRGGYLFHGRVRALVESAVEHGLEC
jgi:large subunit ribosomal protein L18